MDKPSYIRNFGMKAWVILVELLLLVSCDNAIYDDEGDCSVTYHLKFRYDMNMKFADAFTHEVKSVRLYAFNSNGELVWQADEQGEILASGDYTMKLELAPGDYHLMAWCGLDNGESFTVTDASHNCRMTDLHCKLNRYLDKATGVSYSNKDMHPLFHGSLDVSLPANDDGGDYTYVMPLTKDTNVFRVVLQHLSGQDINVDDFTFSIEDRNGWIAHDNTLKEDEPIVYRAWSTYSGEAGVDIATGKESRVTTIVKVAVAELTVSRLVLRDWSLYSRPMLIIRTTEGKLVASIPIIDYALLVKGNYNRKMSDQEYLDRQDEYNMTFFLDEQNQWINSVILINSWRVVLSNVDVD